MRFKIPSFIFQYFVIGHKFITNTTFNYFIFSFKAFMCNFDLLTLLLKFIFLMFNEEKFPIAKKMNTSNEFVINQFSLYLVLHSISPIQLGQVYTER